MRNILSLIFAGVIGGLITLGGLQFMNYPTQSINDVKTPIARKVNKPITNNIPTSIPLNFTAAADRAMPTVVHIKASESPAKAGERNRGGSIFDFFGGDFGMPFGEKKGTGSGVILTTDGYIVTNKHVIDFADELEVTLYDDRTFKASVIGIDPRTDLAVIKIDANHLPAAEFGDSEKAKVGEWVLAVGNPFDLTSTVTAGIISAKGRDIDIIKNPQAIESFIQTDAAVNPGNSGGALVDMEGRLLGINTAIATPTGTFAGYSFAIPVDMVKEITANIIEHGGPRGMLGISVEDVDEFLVRERNLSVSEGVYIAELVDGGAAQFAGVLPNDVIIAVDGQKVKDAPELISIVDKAKVGDVIELTINRKGKVKKIPVALKAG